MRTRGKDTRSLGPHDPEYQLPSTREWICVGGLRVARCQCLDCETASSSTARDPGVTCGAGALATAIRSGPITLHACRCVPGAAALPAGTRTCPSDHQGWTRLGLTRRVAPAVTLMGGSQVARACPASPAPVEHGPASVRRSEWLVRGGPRRGLRCNGLKEVSATAAPTRCNQAAGAASRSCPARTSIRHMCLASLAIQRVGATATSIVWAPEAPSTGGCSPSTRACPGLA